MSTHNGPNIVKSGLVLHLDAANTKSYPGSGTIWFDLSGNNINFNQYGSVTFSGYRFTNFTESLNYFEISDTTNVNKLPLGASDRTILALCKTPSTYTTYSHVFHYGSAGDGQAFGLVILNNKLATHPWVGSPVSDASIPTSTPVFLSVSYTSSSSLHKFYQNGIELTSSNATRTINTGAGTKMARVGTRISNPQESWQTTGEISIIMIYNRVLSQYEISQNFNALRGRYGI